MRCLFAAPPPPTVHALWSTARAGYRPMVPEQARSEFMGHSCAARVKKPRLSTNPRPLFAEQHSRQTDGGGTPTGATYLFDTRVATVNRGTWRRIPYSVRMPGQTKHKMWPVYPVCFGLKLANGVWISPQVGRTYPVLGQISSIPKHMGPTVGFVPKRRLANLGRPWATTGSALPQLAGKPDFRQQTV